MASQMTNHIKKSDNNPDNKQVGNLENSQDEKPNDNAIFNQMTSPDDNHLTIRTQMKNRLKSR
jgi:hypothetical protein